METDLKSLEQAIEGDWIQANPGTESYLRQVLGKVVRGEGVVLTARQTVRRDGPSLPGKILIPTGGTTGKPKHVIHTWETLSAAAENLKARIGGPIHSCCILPLHHVSGFMQVVRALVTGGKVIFPDPKHLDVNPEDLCLSLVPTQLQRFLLQPEIVERLQHFRIIFLGGAAVNSALLSNARGKSLPLAPCYGMTETAAMVTLLEPQDFLAGKGCCGPPLSNVQIEIHDGCIRIQSSSLYEGYWPEGMQKPDKWFDTQDSGFLDQNGSLHITGRLDHVIITGGEKVDPIEVEAALLKMPDVEEALVVGVEDAEWGQKTLAFVVGKTEDLREKMGSVLPSFKKPKAIIQVETLPLDEYGNVDWAIIQSLI